MIRYRKVVLVLVLLVSTHLFSQRKPVFTQYMYSVLEYNPAYAGIKGVNTGFLLYKNQWFGVPGAPTFQMANVHMPVKEKIGIGVSLLNDKVGPVNQGFANASFSYLLRFPRGHNLSLGFRAGLQYTNIYFSQLQQQTVELTTANNVNGISPNFGAGAFYFTDRFYAGISVPEFVKSVYYSTVATTGVTFDSAMSTYLTAGYSFYTGARRLLEFRPSTLMVLTPGLPLNLSLSLNALYLQKITMGLNYSLLNSASLMGAYKMGQFTLGAAYDYQLTSIANSLGYGSFELFLRFEYLNRRGKCACESLF